MLVTLFGMPRSGTSWCGKIFDSHPEIAYLHEPDLSLRSALPIFAESGGAATAQARAEIEAWQRLGNARTLGTRPVFRKRGEGALRHRLRVSQIYAAKGLERLHPAFGTGSWMLRPFPGPPPHTVMKTINLLGRADAYMAAAPEMRAIQLLRHPGGYIASVLRGIRKFGEEHARSALSFSALVHSPLGREEGLTHDRLAAMEPVERLSWKWLAYNHAGYPHLSRGDRAVVMSYEAIARDPAGRMQEAFGRLGLPWHPAVEAFISRSTEGQGGESYYAVKRDPEAAARRWRTELSSEETSVIENICGRTEVGRLAMDA